MPAIVDNLIAYRILNMLVTPFDQTNAYKLGIIDEKGANLIKPKNFTTNEQRNAYSYLHRLVFNLKKILNRTPGGESKTKNLVAAFFLIKEAYNKNAHISESEFHKIITLLDEGYILVEDELYVTQFLKEEGEGGGAVASTPANVTGPGVSTDAPVVKKKKKCKYTKVSKFRKWAQAV